VSQMCSDLRRPGVRAKAVRDQYDSAFPVTADHGTKALRAQQIAGFGRKLVRGDRDVRAGRDVVDETQSRHRWWLVLVVSLAHNNAGHTVGPGHIRSVRS